MISLLSIGDKNLSFRGRAHPILPAKFSTLYTSGTKKPRRSGTKPPDHPSYASIIRREGDHEMGVILVYKSAVKSEGVSGL